LKAAASTLHLIMPTGGLIQACSEFVLWIGAFACCIQLPSFSVSFARMIFVQQFIDNIFFSLPVDQQQ